MWSKGLRNGDRYSRPLYRLCRNDSDNIDQNMYIYVGSFIGWSAFRDNELFPKAADGLFNVSSAMPSSHRHPLLRGTFKPQSEPRGGQPANYSIRGWNDHGKYLSTERNHNINLAKWMTRALVVKRKFRAKRWRLWRGTGTRPASCAKSAHRVCLGKTNLWSNKTSRTVRNATTTPFRPSKLHLKNSIIN